MNITKERLGGLLFLLLSLAYGYYATEIPGYPGDEYEPFTASTLPYALAGIGALLSLLLVLFPGGEPLRREEGTGAGSSSCSGSWSFTDWGSPGLASCSRPSPS